MERVFNKMTGSRLRWLIFGIAVLGLLYMGFYLPIQTDYVTLGATAPIHNAGPSTWVLGLGLALSLILLGVRLRLSHPADALPALVLGLIAALPGLSRTPFIAGPYREGGLWLMALYTTTLWGLCLFSGLLALREPAARRGMDIRRALLLAGVMLACIVCQPLLSWLRDKTMHFITRATMDGEYTAGQMLVLRWGLLHLPRILLSILLALACALLAGRPPKAGAIVCLALGLLGCAIWAINLFPWGSALGETQGLFKRVWASVLIGPASCDMLVVHAMIAGVGLKALRKRRE